MVGEGGLYDVTMMDMIVMIGHAKNSWIFVFIRSS
jgi:hypothetical protein